MSTATPADKDGIKLKVVTVDGIEWFSTTDPLHWTCRAVPVFTVTYYDKGSIPGQGWSARNVGCGIGLAEFANAEEAMAAVAERVREKAKENVEREEAHLKAAKAAAKAVRQ